MNKDIDTIVADVRMNLDEIADNEGDFALVTVDDSRLDELIESKIIEAVDYVHANADIELFNGESFSMETSAGSAGNGGVVSLIVGKNKNMLRFVGGTLSSWGVFVGNAVSDTDTDACMRIKARYAGANHNRPAIIKNIEEGGNIRFDFYRAKNSGESAMVRYIPHAVITEENKVNIDTYLYPACINYCAALVLVSLNEADKAKERASLAAVAMGITSDQDKQ